MTSKKKNEREPNDSSLLDLFRAIILGDLRLVSRSLAKSPSLASQALAIGASRGSPKPYFFSEIKHYVYAGDTALHVAAAAYRKDVARELVANGARLDARNGRGAE